MIITLIILNVNQNLIDLTDSEPRVFSILTNETEIIAFQYGDPTIKHKREILAKNVKDRSPREKGEVKDYVLENGIVYKERNEKLLYVAPQSMRKGLLIRFHDQNGHRKNKRSYIT